MHIAFFRGNAKIINTIVNKCQPELDISSDHGYYIEHFAAKDYNGYLSLVMMKNGFDSVKFLFDVDRRTKVGATPLHFAIFER